MQTDCIVDSWLCMELYLKYIRICSWYRQSKIQMNYLLLRGNCNNWLHKKTQIKTNNLYSIKKTAPKIMIPASHALSVTFCIDHIISQCFPMRTAENTASFLLLIIWLSYVNLLSLSKHSEIRVWNTRSGQVSMCNCKTSFLSNSRQRNAKICKDVPSKN